LDRGGQAVSAGDGAGRLPSVQRNRDNLIERTTDARGFESFLEYDDRGNLIAISDTISRQDVGLPLFPAPVYEAGVRASFLASGDVDNDGSPDVVTANTLGDDVSVLLGGAARGFRFRMQFPTGDAPVAVRLVDVDEDGNLDALIANSLSNDVTLLRGNGDGSFELRATFPVGNSPQHLELADMDGDGDLDIATANRDDNSISVVLLEDLIATRADYAVGGLPAWIAFADVNGDGTNDVITANGGTPGQSLSVLLGAGDGTLGARSDIALSNTVARVVALGDLNRDGAPDLCCWLSG
jgi:YD repeat-containing protein